MTELLICTGNPGKVVELKDLLPASFKLLMLTDVGLPTDLPETGRTLERTGLTCVADDTGLEVSALNGAPGVYSARYAGDAKDPKANMTKLLLELRGKSDRTARFRTVMALVSKEGEHEFIGEVKGRITEAPRGSLGFGYDPIFLPEMSDLTFAELESKQKNAISHRGNAVWKLVRFLHEQGR